MRKLLDPTTEPPNGGWKYMNEEDGHWSKASSKGELLHAAKAYRAANGFGIPTNFEELLEDQLCSRMPPGTCRQNGTIVRTGIRSLSLADILAATKTLGEWFLKGMQKVTQGEAERRAAICLGCPFNQPADGCTTCGENDIRSLVASVVGDSHTGVDANLHSCHVCGCTLKAAVWLPGELLRKHANPEAMKLAPAWCWKGQTV